MQIQRNKLNFEGQNLYVGIDVHKNQWNVSIMSEHLEHKTFSQKPEAGDLVNYLKRNFPGANYYSAYEAGFSGFWAHRDLEKLQIKNIVVNAADIPTTQKEKTQKTDKRDSRKIARSLRAGELEAIYVPGEKAQADRTLIRTRTSVRKDLSREKNRVKSFLNFYGIQQPERFHGSSWSKNYMQWLGEIPFEEPSAKYSLQIILKEVEGLRKLLLEVTGHIRTLSRSEAYEENMKLLTGVPGVALITGMTLLTEIEDIKRFQNTDKFAGYVGLVPNTHSSGDKENVSEITFRGHPFLREMPVESAWTAARMDPALHLAFSTYCKRMKPNQAIIRIARKLLNRIYFTLREKRKYEPCVVQ
jgi:transposase